MPSPNRSYTADVREDALRQLQKPAPKSPQAYPYTAGLAGPELFPGGRSQRPGTQLTRESVHKVLAKVARKAGIQKRVHPHTLQNLGRYTHRVAISKARLVRVDDQAVVFRSHGSDTASLSPTEFIGRFLQHVLPNQFVKISHFGLMASGNVNSRLKLAADLVPAAAAANAFADGQEDGDHDGDGLPSVGAVDPHLPWPELLLALTGKDVLLCPRCQQRTIVRQSLPPTRAPPWKADTP